MSILGSLNSVDKARFSVNTLGTAQNWTIEIEIVPINLIPNSYNMSGIANISGIAAPIGNFDMALDQVVYHPTRNSLFGVRAGFIYEFDLNANVINQSKFTNPCFSKSCMVYDSGNDKLWIGTNGDWAAGRLGDVGGQSPALTTAGLYKINPATLAMEQYYELNGHTFSAGAGGGVNWTAELEGPYCGLNDLFYVNNTGGVIYASIAAWSFPVPSVGNLIRMDANNPTGSGRWFGWSEIAITQVAFDTISSPKRIWGVVDGDSFNTNWPFAVNEDFSAFFNHFDSPTTGAHGAIVFSPIGSGFMYLLEMNNTGLIKYNLDGTINSNPNIGSTYSGRVFAGMTPRMRYNSYDSGIYIPCPQNNLVLKYDPVGDSGVAIYSGLNAPHDVVFSPSGVYAVQYSPTGLVKIV